MIIFKKKNSKFDQKNYDDLFHSIENNLRELGFGDVSVNKKMKEFNKILYDILLKLDLNVSSESSLKINYLLISKYFTEFNDPKNVKFIEFETYLSNFFNFCFELPLDNMVRNSIKFKY